VPGVRDIPLSATCSRYCNVKILTIIYQGQSHEIDHAFFDMMHSTKPWKEPELVFIFFLGSCDLKQKGENSWQLMPNTGG